MEKKRKRDEDEGEEGKEEVDEEENPTKKARHNGPQVFFSKFIILIYI